MPFSPQAEPFASRGGGGGVGGGGGGYCMYSCVVCACVYAYAGA